MSEELVLMEMIVAVTSMETIDVEVLTLRETVPEVSLLLWGSISVLHAKTPTSSPLIQNSIISLRIKGHTFSTSFSVSSSLL